MMRRDHPSPRIGFELVAAGWGTLRFGRGFFQARLFVRRQPVMEVAGQLPDDNSMKSENAYNWPFTGSEGDALVTKIFSASEAVVRFFGHASVARIPTWFILLLLGAALVVTMALLIFHEWYLERAWRQHLDAALKMLVQTESHSSPIGPSADQRSWLATPAVQPGAMVDVRAKALEARDAGLMRGLHDGTAPE